MKNTPARLNIAPTQQVPFVVADDDQHALKEGKWWLVPHWAKEVSQKYAMFNARVETAYKSPAFRDAWKSRRCLIPADGYYEWTKGEDGGKDPHCIVRPDEEPFSFAGLWAHNSELDVTSCTIVTMPAAKEIDHLHKRMPAILPQNCYDDWLGGDDNKSRLEGVLAENLGHTLRSYRVSRNINSARYSGDDADQGI